MAIVQSTISSSTSNGRQNSNVRTPWHRWPRSALVSPSIWLRRITRRRTMRSDSTKINTIVRLRIRILCAGLSCSMPSKAICRCKVKWKFARSYKGMNSWLRRTIFRRRSWGKSKTMILSFSGNVWDMRRWWTTPRLLTSKSSKITRPWMPRRGASGSKRKSGSAQSLRCKESRIASTRIRDQSCRLIWLRHTLSRVMTVVRQQTWSSEFNDARTHTTSQLDLQILNSLTNQKLDWA